MLGIAEKPPCKHKVVMLYFILLMNLFLSEVFSCDEDWGFISLVLALFGVVGVLNLAN